MGLNPTHALRIPCVSPGRPCRSPSPIQRMSSLYPFSFHRFPHSFAPMGHCNPFLINHFRTLSHAMEGGGMNPLFPRVISHGSPVTMLQICPFNFNNFHDAPPATPFFSCFCIVAGGVGSFSFSAFCFQLSGSGGSPRRRDFEHPGVRAARGFPDREVPFLDAVLRGSNGSASGTARDAKQSSKLGGCENGPFSRFGYARRRCWGRCL
jgi:hypothetical protein